MNSIAYIACLLVAYSAASPAQSHPRRCEGYYGCSNNNNNGGGYNGYGSVGGFGGNGYTSSIQQQQQQQQSSDYSVNSYNNGFGNYGSSSQFNQQSSSSSSFSTVTSSFSLIGSQIRQLQYGLTSKSMTQQTVTQQMSQLASSFGGALSLVPSCGNCFNQGDFHSSLSEVFQQLTQLLTSVQTFYGPSYNQICAPFSGLESPFKSLFRSVSSNGSSLNNVVPKALFPLLRPVIPGFGQNLYNL